MSLCVSVAPSLSWALLCCTVYLSVWWATWFCYFVFLWQFADFSLLTSQIHSSSFVNELYLSVDLHSGPHFNAFHNMRQNVTSLITAGNLQVFAISTLWLGFLQAFVKVSDLTWSWQIFPTVRCHSSIARNIAQYLFLTAVEHSGIEPSYCSVYGLLSESHIHNRGSTD